MQLLKESQVKANSVRDHSGMCPLPDFCLALSQITAELGCRITLRTVTVQKGPNAQCQQSPHGIVENSFVLGVMPGAGGSSVGVIIDPNFKEKFRTSSMTERYR